MLTNTVIDNNAMLNYFAVLLIIGLAAGRVTYLIVHDEIMRPLREWIWLRSAPEGATIRLAGGEGDKEVPARMMQVVARDADGDLVVMDATSPAKVVGFDDAKYSFQPNHAMREPGFFGQLIECSYCSSFWVTLAFWVAYRWLPVEWHVFNLVIVPLAIWSLATWVAAKVLH